MPLEVKDLSVFLASGEVVTEHISFQIEKGKMLSIVGSSGAGKTTICKAIMGLLGSTYKATGEVWFQGKNLLSLSKKECQKIYGKEICFIMQNPMTAFNPSLRVGKQLEKTFLQHHARTSKDEMFSLFDKTLRQLGLEDTERILKSYPFTLSGGMLQRLMITAALINQPQILVADEATTAIDACNRVELMKELKSLWNFVRNPNYWGEEPEVDSFSIKNIPDNDAKILALKNGEIDFISGIKNVSAESYDEISQTEGFGAKIDEKALQTYYVGYNLNDTIFGDQVIREAISDAIDKDAVVESIYGGLHGKADTFFSSDLPYCDVEQATTTFDIDAANKLLDEAGYTDSDGDGIREKDGTKISADFLYQTGSASDDNLAVYICDQAKKIGIELTPNSAVMMDWYAMVQGGQYGLTIFKTQGGFYDPANVVTNINPQTSMDPILMLIGTTKPEMAELVSELDASTDETRIQEIYNTILTTIADENLTTPLVYMHQLAIYSDKVKDYTFPMDSNFTSIQNIKVK